MAQPGLSSVL